MKPGQSQKASVMEVGSNIVIGWFINVGVLLILGVPFTISTATGLIMIPLSILRSYIIRRMFNFLHIRELLQ